MGIFKKLNCAICFHGLVIRSHALIIRSLELDNLFSLIVYTMCHSKERLATRKNDCPIWGNDLQSVRTDCLIQGTELLIHENGLHNRYNDLLMALFENPHVPSGLS